MNIEISNQTLRNGAALVFVGMTAIAVASPLEVPHAAQPGQPMAALQFNANFQAIEAYSMALEERLAALELQVAATPVYAAANGREYSLGAVYCGSSEPLNGAEVGGVAGAKVRCEAECSSRSAHMCTGEELMRSLATDPLALEAQIPPTAWFQSFDDDGGASGTCNGWTSGSHEVHATVLENTGRFSWNFCDRRYSIACCD